MPACSVALLSSVSRPRAWPTASSPSYRPRERRPGPRPRPVGGLRRCLQANGWDIVRRRRPRTVPTGCSSRTRSVYGDPAVLALQRRSGTPGRTGRPGRSPDRRGLPGGSHRGARPARRSGDVLKHDENESGSATRDRRAGPTGPASSRWPTCFALLVPASKRCRCPGSCT